MEQQNLTVVCPECASTQVSWRIKRQRGSFSNASPPMLHLSCRGCGAGWDEAREPGQAVGTGDDGSWEGGRHHP